MSEIKKAIIDVLGESELCCMCGGDSATDQVIKLLETIGLSEDMLEDRLVNHDFKQWRKEVV